MIDIDIGKIYVYLIIPRSPLIAMSLGCLVEWLIKRINK